jgi:protoporphyrinogen/coproporphyrinogen III oxidase
VRETHVADYTHIYMSAPAQPPRLAVIGGGISGLAAAHRLHRLLPMAELRLFEASPRLGGVLHTQRSGDLLLEHGADSFIAKTPWAVDLCRELGLADQLMPTNQQHRRALVVRKGELHPVPEGFVVMQPRKWGPLLRSPVLSVAGKLRALAEPWVSTPAAARAPGYDESVASFATRRLGREVFDRLVEPLMAGIYVADADQLSLAATMPEFLDAERTHGSLRRAAQATANGQTTAGARYESFFTLRGGMSSLVDALARALPPECVELKAPVVELTRTADRRWSANVMGRPAAEFDGVVIAAPAAQAAMLVEKIDPQLAHLLGRIEYASSVVVTHIYSGAALPSPLEAFGFVVPRIEQRSLLAASFPSGKFPERAPADRVPIRAFLGGALHPDVISQSDDEVAALAHRELRDLLKSTGDPLETHVARWPASMPQYRVGHVQQAGAIEHLAGVHRGLALAGNAYRGVGIPQCIRSGQDAAERLAALFKSEV